MHKCVYVCVCVFKKARERLHMSPEQLRERNGESERAIGRECVFIYVGYICALFGMELTTWGLWDRRSLVINMEMQQRQPYKSYI